MTALCKYVCNHLIKDENNMEEQIKFSFHSKNLTENIFIALEKGNKNVHRLRLDDLEQVDQIHTGGPGATHDLLTLADIPSHSEVLDAGCGLGGSARILAKQRNHLVTGIDPSNQFITTAKALTTSTRLSDQVIFKQGSLLDIPFKNDSFDAVLCQQTLMTIQDKEKGLKEIHRVLRTKGKLILHEIVKGPDAPLHYPVPWAAAETSCCLEPWQSTEQRLLESGFKKVMVKDCTEEASNWWAGINKTKRKTSRENDLGAHLIFGDHADAFGKTMGFNFKWNRIKVVKAIFEK